MGREHGVGGRANERTQDKPRHSAKPALKYCRILAVFPRSTIFHTQPLPHHSTFLSFFLFTRPQFLFQNTYFTRPNVKITEVRILSILTFIFELQIYHVLRTAIHGPVVVPNKGNPSFSIYFCLFFRISKPINQILNTLSILLPAIPPNHPLSRIINSDILNGKF